MRKLMVTAGAAALLVASTFSALAAEATGAIASLDTSAGTVTLDSGQTFLLSESVDADALQIGDQVTVAYEEGADGNVTAISVAPARN